MDSFNANLVKQFLESNWSAFTAYCEQFETDPERIIEELDDDL